MISNSRTSVGFCTEVTVRLSPGPGGVDPSWEDRSDEGSRCLPGLTRTLPAGRTNHVATRRQRRSAKSTCCLPGSAPHLSAIQEIALAIRNAAAAASPPISMYEELDAGSREAIEAHLSRCEQCRTQLAQVQGCDAQVQAEPARSGPSPREPSQPLVSTPSPRTVPAACARCCSREE